MSADCKVSQRFNWSWSPSMHLNPFPTTIYGRRSLTPPSIHRDFSFTLTLALFTVSQICARSGLSMGEHRGTVANRPWFVMLVMPTFVEWLFQCCRCCFFFSSISRVYCSAYITFTATTRPLAYGMYLDVEKENLSLLPSYNQKTNVLGQYFL